MKKRIFALLMASFVFLTCMPQSQNIAIGAPIEDLEPEPEPATEPEPEDTEVENLVLSDNTNSDHIYKSDFVVNVEASDEESGIKSIAYWVTDDEAMENETVGSKEEPIELPEDVFEITVPVSEDRNNSEFVKLHVKAVDNADNERTVTFQAKVNASAPVVTVEMDSLAATTENYYKADQRTAKVTVVDKDFSFDRDCVIDALVGNVTKADVVLSEEEVETMVEELSSTKLAETGFTTFEYQISFEASAHYTWNIDTLKNKLETQAEITSEETESPFDFYVDNVGPVISTIPASDLEWYEQIVHKISFVWYGNDKIQMLATAEDEVSNPVTLSYYKQELSGMNGGENILTVAALEEKYSQGKFQSTPYEETASEAITVYVRAVDKAGNVSYVNSNGVIIDTKPADITLEIQNPTENGFYNRNVDISVDVVDELENGVASGVDTVTYKVWKYTPGQDLNHVNFDTIDASYVSQSGSVQNNKITVQASKNNHNYVAISVKAKDKSGNVTVKTTTVKIDISKPVISITYDNNQSGIKGFYEHNRIATLAVEERNFDAKEVKLFITNEGGSKPVFLGWKSEGSRHFATIIYSAEADYTFGITVMDMAGNTSSEMNYDVSIQDPTAFTVDKTNPEISVSFDNESAKNGHYYDKGRVATITVLEHNFVESGVELSHRNGSDIIWQHKGDVHIGTVSYAKDGICTFGISVTDKAGNNSKIEEQSFVIDQTIEKPSILGVEDSHAYREEVAPMVSIADDNYDHMEVKLLKTRANQVDVDITEEYLAGEILSPTQGIVRFHTLEKELEVDGIYTIYAKAYDLAGNQSETRVTFTKNSFGSVYGFNQYLVSLQDSYVNAVKEDFVISEYNASPLVNGSLQIEVTCDGTPLENLEYDVSNYDNGWYRYDYTIRKENFKKDGVYRIVVSSKDEAGNMPETTNYEENVICFSVDTTPAEITNVKGLDESVLNATSEKVSIKAFDAIGLKKVEIYVNGKIMKTYEEFDNHVNFAGSVLLSQGKEQHVRFLIEDLAGNITDTDAKDDDGNYIFDPGYDFNRDVTVSTNLWVRFMANKTNLIKAAGAGTGSIMVASFICYRRFHNKKRIKA